MDYLLAILMGLIQGLTEFLPISSTAHLRILPALLNERDLGAAFTAVIQLGTLMALMLYFYRNIFELTRDFFVSLVKREFKNRNFLLSLYIIAGTIPVVIAGVLFKKAIESDLRSLYVISLSLIVFAILLLISERTGKKRKGLDDITLVDAILIGIAQAFALIPGASRSGVTICMALFLGYRREDSARFSFLLSIPSVFAAGVYELKEVFNPSASIDIKMVLIATVISFLSGLLAIDFLLKFLANHRIDIFAYYRIALGLIILLFFA